MRAGQASADIVVRRGVDGEHELAVHSRVLPSTWLVPIAPITVAQPCEPILLTNRKPTARTDRGQGGRCSDGHWRQDRQ